MSAGLSHQDVGRVQGSTRGDPETQALAGNRDVALRPTYAAVADPTYRSGGDSSGGPMTVFSQRMPPVEMFSGKNERTFNEWLNLLRRSIPGFENLDDGRKMNHIASRLKNPALEYWLAMEDFTGVTYESATNEMMRVYRDQADVATKMKRMLEMHVQPGQSLRDFVTHFMSYARRKTFAFQMDLYLNGRFCVNALYNGLPDHVRVALVKFRTEGTVEELAQAAIALDDEINGTRKKKEKKGRKGSSSSSSSDSEGDGRNRKRTEARNRSRNGRNERRNSWRRNSNNNRKVEFAAVEKDDKSGFNSRNVRSESRAFDDMDKPLQVEVKDNMRMVRLGGKWYNKNGFRILCITGNRCFTCGAKHQAVSCPRKNNPVFPKETRSDGPNTGKVEPTKTTFKPWPKPSADVKAITEKWEDGLYLYDRGDYDTEVDALSDTGCSEESGDEGELSAVVGALGDDTFYADIGEEYNYDIASVEVLPTRGTKASKYRFDILPVATLRPEGQRVLIDKLEEARKGEVPIVWDTTPIGEEGSFSTVTGSGTEIWTPGNLEERREGEIPIRWEDKPPIGWLSVVSEDEELDAETSVVEVASTTEAVNLPWANARTVEGQNWSTVMQAMQSVVDASVLPEGELPLTSSPEVGCCTPGSRAGAIRSTQLREMGSVDKVDQRPSCSRAGTICSTQLANREQMDASTSTEDFLLSRDKGVEGNVREQVEAVKTPDKTSVTIEDGQTPTTSRVPEVPKVFSPRDLDPKDPITEDFYPEPVKLDPVESRQYIQCHANGRRVLAMPDTGATVNFMSIAMYQREFSHLPLRQRSIHQILGVTDTDRRKGADTTGIVQLRMHFCGKVINTNFLVGKSHDDRLLILGQRWQDMMKLNVGYDLRGNRVVYMDQKVVPSCIIRNGRLVVVRTLHMKNRSVDEPYLQPRRMADYEFPAPEFPEGSTVEVTAGITATGLGVTNHLTTVRNGRIIVPVFNLAARKQQVFPELYKLSMTAVEDGDEIWETDMDGAGIFDDILSGECNGAEVNPTTSGVVDATQLPTATKDILSGECDGAEVNPPTSGGNGTTPVLKTAKDLPEVEPYDAKAGMQRIREMIKQKRARGEKPPIYPDVPWEKFDLKGEELLIVQYGMQEVQDIFAEHKDDLGEMRGVKHGIDVQGSDPIAQPMRPMPMAKRGVVTEEVARMLKCGVIKPSVSPWSSPIVLIKKKDGGWRFCVDYRRVNDITKKDKHPLPRIDEMLNLLSRGKVFQ